MIRAAAAAVLAAAAVAGCAHSPPLAEGLAASAPRAIELDATPFFPQEEFQCGPAALATVLAASGVAVTPEALSPAVFIPGRRGSLQLELVAAARRHGRMAYRLPENAHALVAELRAGRPVLLLQNLGLKRRPVWHYAVLVGYDAGENVAILRSGSERRRAMRWQSFARSWHTAGRWAISVFEPGIVPPQADPDRYREAAAGLESARRFDDAARAWDAWLALHPDDPHAWLGRGNADYARGRIADAADAWARAVSLAPGDAAMRNNLAQALADAGCIEEARRQAERAAVLAPGGSRLAAVIEETRRGFEAGSQAGACTLPGRDWPD